MKMMQYSTEVSVFSFVNSTLLLERKKIYSAKKWLLAKMFGKQSLLWDRNKDNKTIYVLEK